MAATIRQVSVLISVARDFLPDMVRPDVPVSKQFISLAQLYLARAHERLYDPSAELVRAPELIDKARYLLRELDILYIEHGITRSIENKIIALVWEILREALDKASQIDTL